MIFSHRFEYGLDDTFSPSFTLLVYDLMPDCLAKHRWRH